MYSPWQRAKQNGALHRILHPSLFLAIPDRKVTIDDCTHVIDAGRVREMRYDPVTRMSCLVEVWISKVSSVNPVPGMGQESRWWISFRVFDWIAMISRSVGYHWHDFNTR